MKIFEFQFRLLCERNKIITGYGKIKPRGTSKSLDDENYPSRRTYKWQLHFRMKAYKLNK